MNQDELKRFYTKRNELTVERVLRNGCCCVLDIELIGECRKVQKKISPNKPS